MGLVGSADGKGNTASPEFVWNRLLAGESVNIASDYSTSTRCPGSFGPVGNASQCSRLWHCTKVQVHEPLVRKRSLPFGCLAILSQKGAYETDDYPLLSQLSSKYAYSDRLTAACA